jgi:hypothetical protein
VSRTAKLRPSQRPSLSYLFDHCSLYILGPDQQDCQLHAHTRQWPSAHAPRPSSGAPETSTTTPSPKQTPQTPTSGGPAMSTSPASPCHGRNIGHHLRKSTRSISTRSALPTRGDASPSRANTHPWALVRPADCPAQRPAGGAAGTAGRRA